MNAWTRRASTSGVAAVAAIVLTAAPAAAHFCFKPDVNERAAQGMQGSANWMTFEQLAGQFLPDLCPAGVAHLADAAGASLDTLINTHGVMAGGTLRKAESGNKAISHLDIEGLEGAIEDAYDLCD